MITIRSYPSVIPAQAGISADLDCRGMKLAEIPACAGMTETL